MSVTTPIGELPDVPEATPTTYPIVIDTIEDWNRLTQQPCYLYGANGRPLSYPFSPEARLARVTKLLKRYKLQVTGRDSMQLMFRTFVLRASVTPGQIRSLRSTITRLQLQIRTDERRIAEFNRDIADLQYRRERRKPGIRFDTLVAQLEARTSCLATKYTPGDSLKVLFRPVLLPSLDSNGFTLTTPLWLQIRRHFPYVSGGAGIGHPHFKHNDACIGTAEEQLRVLGELNDAMGIIGVLGELRKGWNPDSELDCRWHEQAWACWYRPNLSTYPGWDGVSYEHAYTGEYRPWQEWFGELDDVGRWLFYHIGTREKVVYPKALHELLLLSQLATREPCVYCNRPSVKCYCCDNDDVICVECDRTELACTCQPVEKGVPDVLSSKPLPGQPLTS